MAERCDGDVVFTVTATMPEISNIFPDAVEFYAFGEMVTTGEDEVYVLNQRDIRVVGIKGKCPNFKHGGCSFGAPCPINALINGG